MEQRCSHHLDFHDVLYLGLQPNLLTDSDFSSNVTVKEMLSMKTSVHLRYLIMISLYNGDVSVTYNLMLKNQLRI